MVVEARPAPSGRMHSATRVILGYPVRVDFSAVQIAMVLVIALLVFGPHKLPEIGRQVGRGLREARRQISEVGSELTREPEAETTSTARTTAVASTTTSSAPAPAATSAPVDDEDDVLAGVVVTRGSDTAADDPPTAQEGSPATAATGSPADATDDDADLLDGVVLSGDTPPDRTG